MDELKLAYEQGAEIAKDHHKKEMQDRLKKRLAEIGWKEQSKPPARLSGSDK